MKKNKTGRKNVTVQRYPELLRQNPKIKIAHIAGGLTTGGVEAVIYNYFSLMNQRDYELYYISYDTPNREVQRRFENAGFHVYEVCKKKDHFFRSCMQVLKILREHDIQIVHSHMTLICFVTSFLGWICGIRVRIAHSHLAQHITGTKRWIYAIFKLLTRVTSTHYVACGREAAVYLYGQKLVDQGKVMVMHNAIDTGKFEFCQETRMRMRKHLSLEGRFCVGHVGRFTEQKNHGFLIDIFLEIRKRKDNAVLLLLGEGELESQIRDKVKRLSLEEHVIFAGSRSDIDQFYQAMDVFLMPSLYEGLAVSLVEVQCNGIPIVVSDTVTEEIHLAKAYKILSLSDSPDIWAEAVCAWEPSGEEGCVSRSEARNLVEKAGYDITREAQKLDDFYKTAVE